MKMRESIKQFTLIHLFRQARPTFVLALAALALCLCAPSAPAAESGAPAAVTVGDFTFTPPKGLVEGAGIGAFSGISLKKGVDEKCLSPLYHYKDSGRHVQFIYAKRDEKKPIQALAALLDDKIDPKTVYSLGDNYGLGINGGDVYREWIMFTKGGGFFYIWLYYPSLDVEELAESFKANTPDAEVILAALKSPRVQNWLNFGVLAPNERMSRSQIVYTVPEGWSYTEEGLAVRMTSPDGKKTHIYEPLPDQSITMEECAKMAKGDCQAQNGKDYYWDYDSAGFKLNNGSVLYECMPRPMLRRVISIYLNEKK